MIAAHRFHIRPLKKTDLESVRLFTDQEIGAGYYSAQELNDIFERSQKKEIMCSFVLESEEDQRILGVRISYPPGNWNHGKGQGLKPDLWPHPLNETAYFQSLFLASEVQAQGWGGKLSLKALEALKKAGAQGVVCHAWKESPNNSSIRYLKKIGFQTIAEHKEYWKEVDYRCPRCGNPPCLCTAEEMYLDLEGKL